jgi:two-component system, OmpR family, alkaline phosphatase synthesis response regulator PhoP
MNKILIVDDSEVNLLLLQTIFENDNNIEVEIISDSTKALSRLREGLHNILILDLMMPVIDGFQILEQLKTDPDLMRIPIIVVSAKNDIKTVDKVMEYKVDAFFNKPIILKDIEDKIREILR